MPPSRTKIRFLLAENKLSLLRYSLILKRSSIIKTLPFSAITLCWRNDNQFAITATTFLLQEVKSTLTLLSIRKNGTNTQISSLTGLKDSSLIHTLLHKAQWSRQVKKTILFRTAPFSLTNQLPTQTSLFLSLMRLISAMALPLLAILSRSVISISTTYFKISYFLTTMCLVPYVI